MDGMAKGRVGSASGDELDADDIECIGELGSESDDLDDWMSERPDYWSTLPDPEPPTRAAWLRHQAVQCLEALRSLVGSPMPAKVDPIPPEEWIRLYETHFGRTPPEPVSDIELAASDSQTAGGASVSDKTPRASWASTLPRREDGSKGDRPFFAVSRSRVSEQIGV